MPESRGPSSPGGGSPGDASRPNSRWRTPRGPVLPVGARPSIHPGQTACDETRAAFGRRSIPADRVAARRSSLRFGRNTPGIPPSRALSAGRLAGLGAHAGSTTGCSPRRFAPLIVAFRSEYTRYSSLTRLVSRAPPRPRRSRGFHHRLFTTPLRFVLRCVSVEIHPGQFSRWGLLPHAPCQPRASPPPGELAGSALTRVPPQAASIPARCVTGRVAGGG